jgi:hypothetical protein
MKEACLVFVAMMLPQPCPRASRIRAFDHLDFRSRPQTAMLPHLSIL